MYLGYLESSVSMGFALGPLVGGWLYELGGFLCPFFGLGGMFLIILFMIPFVLPQDKPVEQHHKPLKRR